MKRKPLKRSALSFLILLTLSACLTGCATPHRINERILVQVYAEQRQQPKQHIGIFVPGVLGSVLEEPATGRAVWGNVFSGRLDGLALPIEEDSFRANRDNLIPRRLLNRLSWLGLAEMDVYTTAARIAIQAGGYVRGNVSDPQPGETAYSFPYDWRRDLVEAARRLDDAIQRIKQRQNRPDARIHLLCHSAGGLVARYYVKYGAVDVLDQYPLPAPTYAGAKHVCKIIMLGTPNTGSLEAFRTLHEGLVLPTVGSLPAEALFTMPASYQLLPHEGIPVFVDSQGRPLPVSLYDAENWERLGWSVFSPKHLARLQRKLKKQYPQEWEPHYQEKLAVYRRFLQKALRRAAQFQRALRSGDPAEESRRVEYVVMGANGDPTLRRAILEQNDSGLWRVHFRTRDPELKPLLYGYGDDTVTKESLLGIYRSESAKTENAPYRLPGARVLLFAEGHSELTKNVTFLDNILHTLLDEQEG